MQLIFQPLDTLFFRDGKPFARGDETWADSTFPPSPSVLYGALRTALATIPGREIPFSEVVNQLGEDRLAIENLYYRIKGINYLPLPLDLVAYSSTKAVRRKRRSFDEVHLLDISENKSIVSPAKSFIKYLLHAKKTEIAENVDGGLLSVSDLWDYLDGQQSFHALSLHDFIQSESKVGIGRDKQSKTAADGLLYRVDMKRLVDIQIRLGIRLANTDSALGQSIVQLGGENKLVQMKLADQKSWIGLERPSLKEGSFKIYLSTPAFFTKFGWQPDLQRFGIHANMVAASVGKPLHIGGFDLQLNRPKPMLKAVPAGSVYYYETKEQPDSIIEKLHGKPLSDFLPEQGFGISYIGNAKLSKL
jgi:CRISPR-associated protein Cmr3